MIYVANGTSSRRNYFRADNWAFQKVDLNWLEIDWHMTIRNNLLIYGQNLYFWVSQVWSLNYHVQKWNFLFQDLPIDFNKIFLLLYTHDRKYVLQLLTKLTRNFALIDLNLIFGRLIPQNNELKVPHVLSGMSEISGHNLKVHRLFLRVKLNFGLGNYAFVYLELSLRI